MTSKPGGKAVDKYFYLDISTLTVLYCVFLDSIVFSIVLKDASTITPKYPFHSKPRPLLACQCMTIHLESTQPDFAHPNPQPPPSAKLIFIPFTNQGVTPEC